jgi:hypothetical protein
MIGTKLRGSPGILNSKKIYGMLRDSGNPKDVGDGVSINLNTLKVQKQKNDNAIISRK